MCVFRQRFQNFTQNICSSFLFIESQLEITLFATPLHLHVAMRLWMEMMLTIFSPFPWRGGLPFALSLLGLGCGHLVHRQISCWICQCFKEWQYKKTRTWVPNGLRNRTISPLWTAYNIHFWTLLWVKNKCYIWPLHLGFFCCCNLACTLTNFQRSP